MRRQHVIDFCESKVVRDFAGVRDELGSHPSNRLWSAIKTVANAWTGDCRFSRRPFDSMPEAGLKTRLGLADLAASTGFEIPLFNAANFTTKGSILMQSAIETYSISTQTREISMGRARVGWIISGLIAAFMLFDVVGKFAKPAQVVAAFVRTGWPIELSVPVGVILLACTVLYVIPRTAIFGAILLTGYLGGAVATNLRLENPLFSHTLFPVYFGVLAWIGLWLREPKLRLLLG